MSLSHIVASALREELDRRSKIDALDAYLAELDRELGPISAEDAAAAVEWVDGLLAGSTPQADGRHLRPPAVAPYEGSV